MKHTIRTLVLAAPLATVALTMGATSAMADPVGPGVGVLAQPTGHGDPKPIDKVALPDDDPTPGPGADDLTSVPPCPTHGTCGKDSGDKDSADEDDQPSTGDDIARPTRVDAGTGSSDEGLDLAWMLAGGALVTVSGAAYAARRVARTRA